MSIEGKRFCWRCQAPIQPEDAVDKSDVFSASGAGAVVERHRVCPMPPPPAQTSPVGRVPRSR